MQYTPHYNLNLPEGTDIVNPLIQDNPNYSAIDTALYDNKLRVIGNATHVKTGTNHAITLADSDIVAFKFVATGDYVTGDTFTVDGVTVTPRVASGSTIPNGAFKINSTVEAILDGTLLNLINITGAVDPDNIILSNGESVEDAIVKGSVSVIADGVKSVGALLYELGQLIDRSKLTKDSCICISDALYYRLTYKASNTAVFTQAILNVSPHTSTITRIDLHVNYGSYYTLESNGTWTPGSTDIATAGTKYELIY